MHVSRKCNNVYTQTDEVNTSMSSSLVAVKKTINELIMQYSNATRLEIISDMFTSYASSQGVHAPKDFLQLFLRASLHLNDCNRTNVIYGLAKAVGSMRQDGTDSVMPAR